MKVNLTTKMKAYYMNIRPFTSNRSASVLTVSEWENVLKSPTLQLSL